MKHHACSVPALTRLSQSLINGPALTQRHRACSVPALINEIAVPSPRVDAEAHLLQTHSEPNLNGAPALVGSMFSICPSNFVT